ncbi:MAG: 3-deoxy-D-manno-octulosonic acid transferase [Micavibrio aeruginosavorus]|uniref:3-deoxy-D-manno-octulosonic acid transferase n=1 Tax=Micavibrio aeruginosavorus TaxID=349221 RepID=A0A2W5HBH6_9BACT|nr:MAG: 3-deoxy-D-manno-octulosonic acid transferase [Micavibrio aeruginosavorus]
MDAFWIYKKTMVLGTPVLKTLLSRRVKKGKEDPDRLGERKGIASLPRPSGPLIWMHVASVGEAQSIMSLIHLMLDQNKQLHVLVTSVTKTSAEILSRQLPDRAIHQYAPVDHPDWVRSFLDHWHPNLALWAESELWPAMLTFLKKRHIPSALINAHMSPKSFRNWKRAPDFARSLLSSFLVILAQSKQDAEYYAEFAPHNVVVTENIKYAARPLAVDETHLGALKSAVANRPVWLYASSHDGEEDLACAVHNELKLHFPNLLTIIAPRHPDRREAILKVIEENELNAILRGPDKNLPSTADQVYIVDTMGELGLLYKTAPLAVIGRSFSNDGGGGHNPVEPALLGCAALHGPNIQNSQELYDGMDAAGAALLVREKKELASVIKKLLSNPDDLAALQKAGYDFATAKANVLDKVLYELEPVFLEAHLPTPKAAS